MSRLEKQIKQLSADISRDKRFLRHEKTVFNHRLSSPLFLTLGVLGGFTAGFLVERVKLRKEAKHALTKTSSFMTTVFRYVKKLLTLTSIY